MPKSDTTKNNENTNPVIAYRVGELEKAVTIGFREVKSELQELKAHYATKEEVAGFRSEAHDEHLRLWTEIKKTQGEVEGVQKTVNEISKKNVSMSLVQKIVFAAVGIALLALANGLMDKLI